MLYIVFAFKTSTALASAYGVAVTGTMVITSIMAFIVMWKCWQWKAPWAALTIAPFLGRLRDRPVAWRPQESEVAAVLDVLVDELARPGVHGEEVQRFPGWPEPRRMPYYQVGPYRLWGATYRIVHPLLPRLLAPEWRI